MTVSSTLSDLSELALVACDASYFTSANPVAPGSPLGPLDEGDPTISPRFNIAAGFFEKSEKEIFVQLISVSGIGAATARMMLSHLKPLEVTHAIQHGNIKLLESIKGIGKKTAERLVLELRDKVNKVDISTSSQSPVGNTMQQDALNALIALGITRAQAETSIKKITVSDPGIHNLEELIKKALKAI